MSQQMFSLVDETGTVRTKEEFLNDMSQAYDEIYAEMMEEEQCNCYQKSFIETLMSEKYAIPTEVTVDAFSFLKRTIKIEDEITPDTAKDCLNKIRLWNTADEIDQIPIEERTPIKIYINTVGGSLDATLSIIDTIRLSKTPVYTITYGIGYSGGFFIGIAGHKRFGYKHSSYLFHEGSAAYLADSHKFGQYYDFYSKQREVLKNLVTTYTSITPEEYDSHKKDDWFFDAEEALNKNVIDEISETLI